MRVENGDGGRDGDSLCCYVAITLPQMPLSQIDGVVSLFFHAEGKRGTSNFWCMLVGLLDAVQNQIFGRADRPVCSAETGILGGLSCCLFGFFII